MIPQLDGKPMWVILALTNEVEGNALTTRFDVCGVAQSEKDAKDILWDLGPYFPSETYVQIVEAPLVEY